MHPYPWAKYTRLIHFGLLSHKSVMRMKTGLDLDWMEHNVVYKWLSKLFAQNAEKYFQHKQTLYIKSN